MFLKINKYICIHKLKIKITMEEKKIDTKNISEELKEVQSELIQRNPEKYVKHKKGDRVYKMKLTPAMCVSLLWIYKFYRHNENADTDKYYTKEDFFPDLIGDKEFNHLIKDYTKLKHWYLITPMPTHPDKVIYKKGYWGITDNGIKFCQREVAMPKYALVSNGFAHSHITTPPQMIEDILTEAGADYNELIKP